MRKQGRARREYGRTGTRNACSNNCDMQSRLFAGKQQGLLIVTENAQNCMKCVDMLASFSSLVRGCRSPRLNLCYPLPLP